MMLSRLKNCEFRRVFMQHADPPSDYIKNYCLNNETKNEYKDEKSIFCSSKRTCARFFVFKCLKVIRIVKRELFTFDGWSQDRTALWFDSASSNPNLYAQQKSEKFHIFISNKKLSRDHATITQSYLFFFSMEHLIYQNFFASSASLLTAFRFLVIFK